MSEVGATTRSARPAILAEGIEKSFGDTRALCGLDLAADEGTVLGVLGPNGAGKTTAVRILTTLLKPDGGRAEVAGLDVLTQGAELRSRIGVTGQYAAVDDYLTGFENLEMVGRLYHLPRATARSRADEMLQRFDLQESGSRLAKTYSGGMRRRLDLAASLIVAPPILFLDEPTTGLDPRSRLAMWGLIEELVDAGTTVLLTTQYLDEADRLADSIAVIDHGRVIAKGTADELKNQVGGERLEITTAPGSDLDEAVRVIERHGGGQAHVDRDRRHATVPVTGGGSILTSVVRDLDAARIVLDDLALRRPTLDDVFLHLTGHTAEEAEAAEEERAVQEQEAA